MHHIMLCSVRLIFSKNLENGMNKAFVMLVIGGFTLRSIAMEQPQVAEKSTQYPFALLENLINNSKSGAEIVDLYEAASEKDRDMLIRRVSCFAIGACSVLEQVFACRDVSFSDYNRMSLADAAKKVKSMGVSIKNKYPYVLHGKIPLELGYTRTCDEAYEVLLKLCPMYYMAETKEESLGIQMRKLLVGLPKVLSILDGL